MQRQELCWVFVSIVVTFVCSEDAENLPCVTAAVEPTQEFRGLFLATVTNIDWPRSRYQDVATQRTELLNYMDMMDQTNMNVVVFQVRPTGDAFYSSAIEPWSKYLTGTQGKAPSPLWDPLEFAIQEAHRRNIQVHAWLNPYRANMAPNWDGLAPDHMANKYRQYAYPYDKYLWMDPAAASVADQLISVASDILSRYSVDGILFDDYFYPYPLPGVPFPDNDTYNEYVASGGKLRRDDWRRDNVNRIIVRVKKTISTIRPKCAFGISPFGLYRPGQADGMPPPIKGFDPYSGTYADSKLWLQKGWVDYLAPQLYWNISSAGQSYPAVLDWWLEQNTANKSIFASNGVYRMTTDAGWPAAEITDQIEISRDQTRRDKKSLGNILFSAKQLRDNVKKITDILRCSVYTHRATVPKSSGTSSKLAIPLLQFLLSRIS